MITDKMRLDWLQKSKALHRGIIIFDGEAPWQYRAYDNVSLFKAILRSYDSLREAIDSAINNTEEGKQCHKIKKSGN